jgi:hypothetical protein
VSLTAQTNNRAHTVLMGFQWAVQQYGLPWRIRVDRGGENLLLAVYMIIKRGRNRGSCLWGSSVHYNYCDNFTHYFFRLHSNQRVERMWLELGKNFGRVWKAFFIRLGMLHGLDRRNPHHLWLLHQIFLSEIRADCQTFCNMWNHHPITGKKHNMSPVVSALP